MLARGVAYLKDLGRVVEEHATFPQLYIYSASDPLVAAEAVIAVWRVRSMPQAHHQALPNLKGIKHMAGARSLLWRT